MRVRVSMVFLAAGALLTVMGCLREEPDHVAPAVVETYPAADAERVLRFQPLRLVLSEPPAEASVSTDTVHVHRLSGATFEDIELSIEGSEIRIDLDVNPRSTYTVTVDGVTDRAGNALSEVEWTFHTIRNPDVQRTSFNAGMVTGYTAYRDLDASGNPTSIESFNGTGVDGQWFTADDVGSNYTVETYQDRWLNQETERYAMGADGFPYTADDIQTLRQQTVWDDGLRLQVNTFDGPGTDATWGTDDDDVQDYRIYTYDADGLYTGSTSYDGPGPDGVFFTADDDVSSYATQSATESLRVNGSFNDPGADGDWFTADDLGSVTATDLDADGRSLKFSTYSDFGADGLWYTADDTLSGYRTYEWDGDDLQRLIFYDAGDVIQRIYAYLERNEFLEQVRTANFDTPGVDGEWGTDDDTISNADFFTYDADGNTLSWRDYNDPGPNGTWLDDDDVYGVEGTYDPTL